MSLIRMFNRTFTVSRTSTTKGAHNRPVPGETTKGPYPCRLGKPTSNWQQQEPQGVFSGKMKLYTILTSDVEIADIVIMDNGDKYIVQNVYKPNNHHIECDVIRKAEF